MKELEAELAGLHGAKSGAALGRAQQPGARSLRPQSIAQRASMAVWGRYMAADRCEPELAIMQRSHASLHCRLR